MSTTIEPHRLAAATALVAGEARVHAPLLEGASAATHMPFPDRLDPYYDDEVFADPPSLQYRWVGARRQLESGRRVIDRQPDYLPTDSAEFDALVRRPRVRELIQAVHAFRHVDANQLQAMLSTDRRNLHRWVAPAFQCGLLMRGTPNVRRLGGGFPYIYALNDDRPLRTVETSTRFVAIDGEQGANVATLLPDRKTDQRRPLSGDAVLWRDDGLRVVVEVAASYNMQHQRARLERWAQFLLTLDDDACLSVVWLNAVGAEHTKAANRLRTMFNDVVSYGRLKDAGMPASPAKINMLRRRLLLASWTDWYPQPAEVSQAGVDLACAWTPDGNRWQTTALGDPDAYSNPAGVRYQPPAASIRPSFATTPPAARAA